MSLLVLHRNRLSARRLAKALQCEEETTFPESPPDILLRFGSSQGEEGRLLTINKRQNILGLRHKNLASLYKLHRLPFGTQAGDSREITIHIVDGQIIATQSAKQFSKYERQRALAAALRALYLTGLDLGAVKLIVPPRGRVKITKVTSAPNLTPALAKAYAEAITQYIAKKTTTSLIDESRRSLAILPSGKNFLLGADPEFMIKNIRTDKLIPASRFFPLQGTVGCDNRRSIGELRPAPKSSPYELTESIRSLLGKASSKVKSKRFRLLAGSQPFRHFPIGGHIHFGGIGLSFQLMRALDNYLLIPLFLVEYKSTAIKRRRYYGYLGDIRIKGPGRFEYRSPGSWLVSPKITLAALSLAKIVAAYADYLPQDYFSNPEACRAFYRGDKDFFRPLCQQLRKDLEKTPLYGELSSSITPLWEMIDQSQEWVEDIDLRESWLIDQDSQ
ncbi:hypothetical protein F9B85_07140 [Heliorestis acidaminivorans]|uniref:Phage phiEco32-like COOH-NH2 ligase-type 2 n=1 Tax=Heliorestis acidaminivorans TaxID=553427 RepID=A0A6I0EXL4_9FIRM|nr:hypothetical protein [Heliorestis acidaminivorans]KAB2953030.1 hypothetical protein F9B85_07140 [Heliorestis acidaminivorans]